MEHKGSNFLESKRLAIVTGSNRGIGFEICKQLASKGIKVILTARDEKRGLEAVKKLIEESELESEDDVVFHQLNVTDQASVTSLADFIKTHFSKLDILINNAAIVGVSFHPDAFRKGIQLAGGDWPEGGNWEEMASQSYEMAVECVKTNYYGTKSMVEAFLPLLEPSDSARIVNVSATLGLLKFIPNEWAKEVLGDEENLTEDRIDEVLAEFLNDMKEGTLEEKRWPTNISAYKVSKAAVNAYAKLLAKKMASNMRVNCICPGYVPTEMTCNTGLSTVAEGAQRVVNLALLPLDEAYGHFFNEHNVSM